MKSSWIPVPENCDFPLENLPYGIFKDSNNHDPRVGVAIGEHILDLTAVADLGFFNDIDFDESVFNKKYLNDFMALGKPLHRKIRLRLTHLLSAEDKILSPHSAQVLVKQADATMLMPVKIGDYTDFYSSEEHATNVGKMFRPDNPLLPNWKSLPVAYHGRSSSIVLSGVPLKRPKGQIRPDDTQPPIFSPTQNLDFELEMGFFIGKPSKLSENISTADAEEHIFGMVLFNDWSARDIQRWEYQPLGPFLSKNFGSSISSWVVTLEALEPFRKASPLQDPPVLEYLQYEGNHTFDINLEVYLQPETQTEYLVTQSNFSYLYWNICQQLAHHTINGCPVNTGDLMASGTISGKEATSFGSMLELTNNGKNPIILAENLERKFVEDGDTVIMRAFCKKDDLRIGFGEVRTKILS
jgi:fumarylacetoacetase